jgi:membrane-associated protease RseP (regulator of RpoE activity)
MRRVPVINIVLFIITCFFVLLAGALMAGANPFEDFSSIISGAPFAFSLMLILLSHELSHYVASIKHNVEASLPYFIPVPPIPGMITIGTFGAFIKMRSPIVSRRALIDIGASGPIVGFMFAVLASVYGLMNSEVMAVDQGRSFLVLGDSLLFSALSKAIIGPVPEGMDVFLHPAGFAGWLGFFVTSLNLIPIGQLDGGHILYAFTGSKHALYSKVLIGLLVIMGFLFWPGWILWAVLLLVLGLRHPPVMHWEVPLDPNRRKVGLVSLAIFILTFTPIPFTITGI